MKKKGFTILEIILVFFLLGILLCFFIPKFNFGKINFDNSTKEFVRDLRLIREWEKNGEDAYIRINYKDENTSYKVYKNKIQIKQVKFPKGVSITTTINNFDVIKINNGKRNGVPKKGFSVYLKYKHKNKNYQHKITVAVASGRILLYEDKKGN